MNHCAQVALLNSDFLTKNDDFYLKPKRKTRMERVWDQDGLSHWWARFSNKVIIYIIFSRDKLNNLVLFDKPTYEKLLKEVPTYKLITPSIVSERLKVRGSLARKALIELTQKGLIKQVVQHHAQQIYTRNVVEGETPE